MKAVVLRGVTAAEDIEISEIEMPKARPGWVVVKVMAFGMNHSEQILRLDEIRADYIKKPIVPGIECAGVIEDASDSRFVRGQRVVAMMGGMGRNFDGSYEEYALLPASHVFAADCDLPWERLAALPETYFTAWGSLFECLNLKKDDVLLVRGATCALGYAAVQIAKALGCTVIATTHREEKLPLLHGIYADECILDDGALAGKVRADKVLELVGPKTLRDSLRCACRGGIVCNTGILGGVYYLDGFDPIKEIPNGVYLSGFFSNYPTQRTVDDILTFLRVHMLQPMVGAVHPFADIKNACADMEHGKVNGKIVVKVN